MQINNNSNTVQAFWVSLGSLFSFGFSLVSSMILSRYFLKEDYGTYKQVLYVYNTLLTIFTLGLPRAFSFYLPRVPLDEAKNLIKKLTNMFFLLGSVFSLLLFIFSPQIAILLKNPELEPALKIFSPVPLLMLPTMGLEGILSTFRRTQFLTIYTISTRILMLLCVALPVIVFKGGYIQAIVGFVIASFLSFVLALYFKNLPVRNAGNEKCRISYNEIFKFSFPLLYASLWGILISSSDQFFISRYFGTKVFAEFSNGWLQLPFIGMITGACATVLSPLYSKLAHESVDQKKEIYPIWMSVLEKSAKLIYPLLVYCWFFSDDLMIALYGKIYENSSIYFKIKLVVNLTSIMVYAPLIISIGKIKYYRDIHMYTALCLIALQYIGIVIFKSPYVVAIISVICSLGMTTAGLLLIAKYFNVKLSQTLPLKILLKIIVPSILILSILRLLFNIYSINIFFVLPISFTIYTVLYYCLSFPLKLNYLSIIKPLIFKTKI